MKLELEILEPRDPAASFGGSVWPSTNLTFSIDRSLLYGSPGGVAAALVHTAVVEALSLWAGAAPLNFTEVASGGQIDFQLQYKPGTGVILAEAEYPVPGGTSHVYVHPQDWTTGPTSTAIDLVYGLTHEIGHVLGMAHETTNQAVMNTFYANVFHGLGSGFLYNDDKDGIRQLYGAGTGSVSTLPSPGDPTGLLAIPSGPGTVAYYDQATLAPVATVAPFQGYAGTLSAFSTGSTVTLIANNGHARALDAATGVEIASYLTGSTGAVAIGDVNSDGIPDVAQANAGRLSVRSGLNGSELWAVTPHSGYDGPLQIACQAASSGGGYRVATLAPNGHLKMFRGGIEQTSLYVNGAPTLGNSLAAGVVHGQQMFVVASGTGQISVFDPLLGS